jgi:hypothetical protein
MTSWNVFLLIDPADCERATLELSTDRRIQWTITTSHREARRKIDHNQPDALVVLTDRAMDDIHKVLVDSQIPETCIKYIAHKDKSVAQPLLTSLGFYKVVSLTTMTFKTLSHDLISDLEIIKSALTKQDLITRAPVFSDLPVGFICSSTGGPRVVTQILKNTQIQNEALIVLQHMTENFVRDFARRIATETNHEVRIVDGEEPLEAGRVYLPSGGHHLLICRAGHKLLLRAMTMSLPDSYTPSINLTLLSAAAHLHDRRSVLILSGMGEDGLVGAVALHQRGASIFSQNPSNAAVASMPEAPLRAGVAELVSTDSDLATKLMEGLSHGKTRRAI